MTSPTVDNKLLIQCVKAHDVLYNADHPKYSNGRYKEDVWEKVAFMLGVPSEYGWESPTRGKQ